MKKAHGSMELGTTTLDMVIGGMRGITVGLCDVCPLHGHRSPPSLHGQRRLWPTSVTSNAADWTSSLLQSLQTSARCACYPAPVMLPHVWRS